MTLEEIDEIIKTEKFCTSFYKSSYLIKVKLINMRDIFSLHFNITKEKLYSNTAYFNFFRHYINNAPELDIDKIKLDLINKEPILKLSLKYIEPIEVIEEIKNKIEENVLILDSRIYTASELCKIFNMFPSGFMKNPLIQKISYFDKKIKSYFWLGKDINNNLGVDLKIKNQKKVVVDKKNLVSLQMLKNNIDIKDNTIDSRIKKKLKIFGVELDIIKKGKDGSHYIKEEDYLNIIKNKKYYISKKESEIFVELDTNTLAIIRNYYNIFYNKNSNFIGMYIKKDTAIKIKEIVNNYKNNYSLYVDNFYNFIKESDCNVYNYRNIFYTFGYCNKNKKSLLKRLNIEPKMNSIDKNDVLRIMEYLKSTSYKYKKSKQQGETNG